MAKFEKSVSLNRRSLLALSVGAAAAVAGATFNHGSASATPRRTVRIPGAAYASDYGYDPVDATDALQAALDSTAPIVVIDDVGAEWLTRQLHINRDDVTVLVEPAVIVRAKPGGFADRGACLLNIKNRSNVALIGYGATLKMNKQEYIDLGDGSQWRHVVNVYSSTDVIIEGLTLASAGGDGIYIGRDRTAGRLTYCRDVIIRNVRCDDNFRNGLSVISADRLLVEHSEFVNTKGQNPMSGIDLEPNSMEEQLTNISIRDCSLHHNERAALTLAMKFLAGSRVPISINMERLYLGAIEPPGTPDRMTFAPNLLYVGPLNGPGGSVALRDSFIEVSPYSCGTAIYPKDANGESLLFERVASVNWGNLSGHYENISILGATNPNFGGIKWQDCSSIADQTTALIDAHVFSPYPATIKELTGNITSVNPNGTSLELGPKVADIDLAIRELLDIPPTVVNISAVQHQVTRGEEIELVVTRASSDLAAPLAVRIEQSGTAVAGVDTALTATMVVIPPGETEGRVVVPTRELGPLFPADPRSVVARFTLVANVAYALGDESETTVAIGRVRARLGTEA